MSEAIMQPKWLGRFYIRIILVVVLASVDLLMKAKFWNESSHTLNMGGVLGMFPRAEWSVAMALLWLVTVYEWWQARTSLAIWGWSLVVAGGLGNIIDRWWLGGVRDFICYPVIDVCGNVADVWLTVGVGALVWGQVRGSREKRGNQVDQDRLVE